MRPGVCVILRASLACVPLVLGGCASTPHGVLAPVAAGAPGTSRVEMLVATTRKADANPGVMYSGERGATASYADITVSIPPDATREPGTVQWPKELPGNPATDFVSLGARSLDRAAMRSTVSARAGRGRRPVLVFVHGFNNRYEDAVYRFAQIVHDAGTDAVPVLFTWPSRGSVMAYGYDRESTNYSRNALETLLRDLSVDPSVGSVTVLAHSMGNWLVLESLRQMSIRDGRVSPKIKDVMLAAPDVDVDLAREAFRDMGPGRPNLTLVTSQDDNALAFSKLVWGDVARLGAIDPDIEPYRTDLEREGISVVNLTKEKSADALNHGKFASSPKVVQLLGRRLASGQTVTDSHVGIGDRIVSTAVGAATTVGTAGALVLSAPVAVVDPQTRENYGDHLRNLGDGIGGTAEAGLGLAAAPGRALMGR